MLKRTPLSDPAAIRVQRHSPLNRYDFAFETLGALRPALPSPRVFDIGCGDARMQRIESHGLTWQGFDQAAWRLAKAWNLNDPCPANEKAGAALLLDVLGCCGNPALALQNVSDALLPGARLIFTDPNPHWSASRLYYLLKGSISSYRPEDVDSINHLFTPWPHVVTRLMWDAGLEVEDYVSLEGRTRLGEFGVVRGLAQAAIERLDERAIGRSYALVARKL